MREAHEKVPIRLAGFCLLSNHFHLLLWPHEDGELSRWMQWLTFAATIEFVKAAAMSGSGDSKRFLCSPMNTI